MSILQPANGAPRLSLPEYLSLCKTHFILYWKHYTLPVIIVCLLSLVIRIDVNYTESLPDHVFVTVKGWKGNLKKGDYVAYKFPTENHVSPFRKGDHMVKIIGGVEGDMVVMKDNRAFQIIGPEESKYSSSIGGRAMGISKTHSLTGRPLEAGPVGIIPKDRYYVFAPHKDSLDSRYAMVGWLSPDDIIGKTFSIF